MTRGEDSHVAKLTEQSVMEIRKAYATRTVLHRDLAERYGVSGACISVIVNRKAWTHI